MGRPAALKFLSVAAVGAACAASLLLPATARAQVPAPQLAMCGACHGADGNSLIKEIPSLAGQPRIFLENQLVLIREGMRDIPQMKAALEGVTDAGITDLARHYTALPVARPAAKAGSALYTRGETLARESRCGICHLPNYVGREQMPRLAGQREDYLLYSMRQFKSNQAVGRDSIMAASLYGVPDDDLRALAHYLAHLSP